MNTKIILLIIMIASLSISASAEDLYKADLQIVEWHNDTNVLTGTWIPQDLTLFTNESNTLPFTDGTVKFIRGISETTGYFTVTGIGIENPGMNLIEGSEPKLIRDTQVNNNGTYVSVKKIKIQLINIKVIAADTTTNTTAATDNPIYAYVYYDRELPMAKDRVNNFDGESYIKQTGWTTDGGVSEISVYFRRKDTSIPMAISVKAESTEPKVTWTDRTAKYVIDSNGKYEFTIKYETKNTWGWKEEFTEIYTLKTIGMNSKSSGKTAIVSEASYEPIVGRDFILTMSAPGKFEGQNGVKISDNGNQKFTFNFDNIGQYEFKFIGESGGSGLVKFSVKPASTTESTNTNTNANQAQPNGEGGGGGLLWYIILLIAVLGLGYLFISRKKKGSPVMRLHPKAQ